MADQDPATVRARTDPNQVKLGQAFRVGAEGDDAVNLMVTLLDRQDSALPIRRLRDWGLGLANVGLGETVVDVGSGTGTMLREFGTLVGPGGRAVGVEPNPRLRAVATERANASANISVIDGLAGTLPFDDERVDLVWAKILDAFIQVSARHAVTLGLIGQEEADEVSRAHRAAGAAGYAFAAVTVFGFLLHKPA